MTERDLVGESKVDVDEPLQDKLARECRLLYECAVPGCTKAAQEAAADPLATTVKVGIAAALGFGLSYSQRFVGLPQLIGRGVAAGLGTAGAFDLLGSERLSRIGGAIAETWKSKEGYKRSMPVARSELGRFLFDTVALSAAGVAGGKACHLYWKNQYHNTGELFCPPMRINRCGDGEIYFELHELATLRATCHADTLVLQMPGSARYFHAGDDGTLPGFVSKRFADGRKVTTFSDGSKFTAREDFIKFEDRHSTFTHFPREGVSVLEFKAKGRGGLYERSIFHEDSGVLITEAPNGATRIERNYKLVMSLDAKGKLMPNWDYEFPLAGRGLPSPPILEVGGESIHAKFKNGLNVSFKPDGSASLHKPYGVASLARPRTGADPHQRRVLVEGRRLEAETNPLKLLLS